MKKKKVVWIVISVIVIILLIFGYFRLKDYFNGLQDQMLENRSDNQAETTVEIKNEIIFSGKVTPKYTQNINLSSSLSLDNIDVTENQDITNGDTILTYYGAKNINDLITIQENKFVGWQEDRNWYHQQITSLEQELSWADPTDDAYVTSLQKDIARYNTLLATNEINWNTALSEIERLKASKDDYIVTADFDGFVYQINEDAKSPLSTSAYIIIYSTERVVTVEVSEYELQYIQAGAAAEITVEGLNKSYTGTISNIDIMPNNITSNDTSYFNIEVTIPSEVPYGYSVIIAVKTS